MSIEKEKTEKQQQQQQKILRIELATAMVTKGLEILEDCGFETSAFRDIYFPKKKKEKKWWFW